MRPAVVVALLAGCSFRLPGVVGDDQVPPGDGSGSDGSDSGDGGDGGMASCDATASFADGLAPARDVFVSAAAGATQDGSQQNPFRRVAQALPIAPGTRVVLAAGAYPDEVLNDVHGTATAPIWIEGPAAGARATFASGTNGIHLVKPLFVVIRHVDIASTTTGGINADDGGDRINPVAHHLLLEDVNVTSAGIGIQLTGVSDVTVRDSQLSADNKGVLLVGVHRATVARLAITTATVAIQAAAGSSDIDIRQNVITSTGQRPIWLGGNSDETEFRPPLTAADGNFEASNIRVFDNVLSGGITMVMCSLCTQALVASNFIHGDSVTVHVARLFNEHGALGGHAFAPAGSMRFLANAMEVSTDPFGFKVEAGTDGASCVFSHNLWLETDDPSNSMPALPTPDPAGIYGQPSGYDDTGTLCAGASQHAGVAVPEVAGTLAGSCRPDPPSIGPSEPTPGC
jgi:parallel beta helix pectate lyase-like protein